MVELPSLYEHQIEHKDRLRASLARNRRVILQAEPGHGKTRMAKWIIGSSLNREPRKGQSGYSLFAVHRRGLVDNASQSFSESPGLPHGVLMSGREHDTSRRVQVASIDTLLSWFCEGGRYKFSKTFDLIVFDECHSHHSKLMKFLSANDKRRDEYGMDSAYVIGLSATPEAKGLADVYGDIVSGKPTEWLIEHGYLSPFRYYRATRGQLGKLVRRGGEFTRDSVCDAMEGLAGDLVRDWKQYAEGRPTVGFFPRLSHAEQAREILGSEGVKAEYVDGDTPDDRRHQLFRWLGDGTIDYLCNVGVIERGTNIPAIGCVQLCTAIGSVVRYRQMVGRGSRVCDGKADCLVLDHGDNVARLGFFEDRIHWTLDNSEKDAGEQGIKPTIECPQCQAIYRGGLCRACGYEPTPKERKSQGLEFDGSELQEVTRKDKARAKNKTCEEILVESLYQAGRSGRTWKQALGMCYSKAKKQGTRFRVPRNVEVGGERYRMLPYGSPDAARRVSAIYPFTTGSHGGPYREAE